MTTDPWIYAEIERMRRDLDRWQIRDIKTYVPATSFTPAVRGETSAGTYTYNRQNGHWIQFGELVWIEVDIILSGISSAGTGNLQIDCPGAPAPVASFATGALNWAWRRFLTYSGDPPTIHAMVVSGALRIQFQTPSSGGSGLQLTTSALAANTHMIIVGSYRTG